MDSKGKLLCVGIEYDIFQVGTDKLPTHSAAEIPENNELFPRRKSNPGFL